MLRTAAKYVLAFLVLWAAFVALGTLALYGDDIQDYRMRSHESLH